MRSETASRSWEQKGRNDGEHGTLKLGDWSFPTSLRLKHSLKLYSCKTIPPQSIRSYLHSHLIPFSD